MVSALQGRYINLMTDFGFHRIFGTEQNQHLLIDFLNAVVLREHHQIVGIKGNNVNNGLSPIDNSNCVFEVYCEGKNGDCFMVEIQKGNRACLKDSSIYYSTFPTQYMTKRGIWDVKIDAVYVLCIVDFILDIHDSDSEFLHTIEIKNQRGKVFYDKLKLIYIELPKFK
jgi:PD-(D/E)XK nuclease family transposase